MSSETPPANPILLLWGSTQVGKSCLLAAGLLHDPNRFPSVDWERSRSSVESTLRQNYRHLSENTLVAATGEPVRSELTFRSGKRLAVQDVLGGYSATPEKAEHGSLIDAAAAILFAVEWGSADQPKQMEAVAAILPYLKGRPAALAFTKCERAFDPGHAVWQVNGEGVPLPGWWRSLGTFTTREAGVLEQLAVVWPTSVYGYGRDGRPACLLDEFGDLIPYHIGPRNVAETFRWFFARLGL